MHAVLAVAGSCSRASADCSPMLTATLALMLAASSMLPACTAGLMVQERMLKCMLDRREDTGLWLHDAVHGLFVGPAGGALSGMDAQQSRWVEVGAAGRMQ